MAEVWTADQVKSLAPDTASIKAGQGQAKASKWPALGRSDIALWGECKGSGSKPYQVRVDLREPAFKCSCPSRKFPCKHAIGLMLLLAEQSSALKEADAPEWVTDWLATREQRVEKREAKAKAAADKPVDAEAQAKRIAKREKNVESGLDELATFIADVMRQGLAAAQTQPGSYWSNAAARMVDAQAPGLARMVRQLGETVSSGDRWQDRFLRQLGRLHLAIEGYRRIDEQTEATQADLRALIGWTQSQDELLVKAGEAGRWCVVGQEVEEEDRVTAQRTWLVRQSDGKPAMVLQFAAGQQPLDTSLMVGMAFEGELIYYPGAVPMRALVKSRAGDAGVIDALPGETSIECALDACAEALAANPWIERMPMLLRDVVLVRSPGRDGRRSGLHVRDSAGSGLELAANQHASRTLRAISGGRPISLFGEWDGDKLRPMGSLADGTYARCDASRDVGVLLERSA